MPEDHSSNNPTSQITSYDLREMLRFCSATGQIWLHEHRMLMIHTEALASLRKELIEALGMDRARGFFTRMGYESGVRDAELVAKRTPDLKLRDTFMTGPQLHTLEGMVKVNSLTLQIDQKAGRFYGEDRWDNSWEGQCHKRHYGIHSEPVCWSLVGYASGYSSTFMGRPILYKEVECIGKGDRYCRVIGQPVEEWEDASEYTRFLDCESIAEQLIDLQTQVVQLRSAIGEKEKLPSDIVGESKGFRAAFTLMEQASGSNITVLLQGETGVGKEVFARLLHERGLRSSESFIAINCAAIPSDLVESELFGAEKGAFTGATTSRPGRFERANGGTLFLDEIGDLPLSAQAKLLRVLQEGEIERLGDQQVRKIDVRLIAAANVDLKQLVAAGKFRSDLYYRLNGFQINIPPLRERKVDIPLIANRFLEKYSTLHAKKLRGFTDKAKRALLSYLWPGNIREMQNMVERGVLLAPSGTRIELEHMFSPSNDDNGLEFSVDANGGLDISPGESGKDLCDAVFSGVMTLHQIEAMLIKTAVDKAQGNLSSAARMLGLTRPQLAYRLGRLEESNGKKPANNAIPSYLP